MASREVICPVCNADIPLSGDEAAGEEIFCAYCGSPCVLTGSADDDECDAEADF